MLAPVILEPTWLNVCSLTADISHATVYIHYVCACMGMGLCVHAAVYSGVGPRSYCLLHRSSAACGSR